MKKLTLLIVISLCLFTSGKGQELTFGNLDCLKGKTVKIVLDFSNAVIDIFDYETMCELDEDWKKTEKEMYVNFIKIVAEELSWHDIRISNNAELDFIFIVNKIDDDGEIYADAKIVDKEGNVLAIINKLNGDGGRGRTIAKRAKVAVERMAKSVGYFFDLQRSKAKKDKRQHKKKK